MLNEVKHLLAEDPSLALRMTKAVLRMTGELGRTRRSVMLNEVKHLLAEDPSLALRMTKAYQG